MGDSIKDEFLQSLISDLENGKLVLPTLPEVALKVRDALGNDNSSQRDVAKVIATDAALSIRILHVANSPLMRATKKIDTLEAAVARMGNSMVRNLVTSLVMEQMFQATSDATDSRLRALWEHSTQVAAISHVLAAQFTKRQSGQAMLAGLVHDIGALPILTQVEDYPQILDDEALLDSIISEAHTQIGKAILEMWHFSPELIAVVSEHENLQYDGGAKATDVDIVIVANLQSHIGTNHPLTNADWNTVPSFKKLGLDTDVNVVEMVETSEDIETVKSTLKL